MGLPVFPSQSVQIQQRRNIRIVSAHIFLDVFAIITVIESNAGIGKVDPGIAVVEILFGFVVEIIDADALHSRYLLF